MDRPIDPLVEEGYLSREAAEEGYAVLTTGGLDALMRNEGPFGLALVDKDGEPVTITVQRESFACFTCGYTWYAERDEDGHMPRRPFHRCPVYLAAD